LNSKSKALPLVDFRLVFDFIDDLSVGGHSSQVEENGQRRSGIGIRLVANSAMPEVRILPKPDSA